MSDLSDANVLEENIPEFSVSDLSIAIKRHIEGEFSHVMVKGEIGRVSRPASGHIYLDIKDEKSTLAGIIWKGNAQNLKVRPEEGLEVINTFLLKHSNWQRKPIPSAIIQNHYEFITKDGDIRTLPFHLNNNYAEYNYPHDHENMSGMDGFFSTCLIQK